MDGALQSVEIVDASSATKAVMIDLHNQTEGFTITGSGLVDTITGGAGADTIDSGSGNDIIKGFGIGDSVDGGPGVVTAILEGA